MVTVGPGPPPLTGGWGQVVGVTLSVLLFSWSRENKAKKSRFSRPSSRLASMAQTVSRSASFIRNFEP